MSTVARDHPPLFHATPLLAVSAARAYSLVRLFEGRLDRSHWRAFVRRQTRPRNAGGVMMLADARGAAHAVFSWRIRHNLLGERVLSISDAVLGSLPGRALGDALVDAIVALAQERACGVIEYEISEGQAGPRSEALVARGFRRVGGDLLLARVGGI